MEGQTGQINNYPHLTSLMGMNGIYIDGQPRTKAIVELLDRMAAEYSALLGELTSSDISAILGGAASDITNFLGRGNDNYFGTRNPSGNLVEVPLQKLTMTFFYIVGLREDAERLKEQQL